MSFYTDHLALEPIKGGWKLTGDLRWEIGKKGSGLWFLVKAGFVSDLATIPWWARWLLNPADPAFAKASILHDAMLADPYWSRREAAAAFTDALVADGVKKWTSNVMGLAVLGHTLNKGKDRIMKMEIGDRAKVILSPDISGKIDAQITEPDGSLHFRVKDGWYGEQYLHRL